jgi:pimeloyl-ACP methyl ester carboxylesterase
MAVLVHGLPLEDVPPELAELYEPIWQQMQRDVAALVPGANYHIVANTTHDIHGDRPDIVANTIIDIFAAGRDQQD